MARSDRPRQWLPGAGGNEILRGMLISPAQGNGWQTYAALHSRLLTGVVDDGAAIEQEQIPQLIGVQLRQPLFPGPYHLL